MGNPVTNILDFGHPVYGTHSGGGGPGAGTGKQPYKFLPLTQPYIDFGKPIYGTHGGSGPGVGTDYQDHAPWYMAGLGKPYIDFGRLIHGTSGSGPAPSEGPGWIIYARRRIGR